MFRSVLPLWRFWTFPLLMLGSLFPFLFVSDRVPLVILVMLLSVLPVVLFERVVRRLFIYAIRCRTVRGKHLSIHAHPELLPKFERDGLLEAFEYDYEALTRWFGSRLRRRVAVFVMPRHEDISRAYRKPIRGFAHFRENAIVIPADEWCRAMFRHELTHLFANRLGMPVPAFKMEGLCVWFERDGGWPNLDEVCRRCLDRGGISSLLDRRFFRDPKNWHAGYRIAGSFTAYLIERFGWEKYRAFYKAATRRNFEKTFERSFSLTLGQAESQWREAEFWTRTTRSNKLF